MRCASPSDLAVVVLERLGKFSESGAADRQRVRFR